MRSAKKEKPEAELEKCDPSCDSFEARKKDFDKYYLWLVIMCGLMGIAAVAVALYIKFFAGIVIFAAVPLVYSVFLSDRLQKSFGLICRTTSEGVSVAVIRRSAKSEDEEAEIPDKLMWYNVISLHGAGGKKQNVTLKKLYIPDSVKSISEDSFKDLPVLKELHYRGSREEWERVDCKADISGLLIVCRDEEEPETVNEADSRGDCLLKEENTGDM